MSETAPPRRHTAATPSDTIICAIGDIHGRLDLLEGICDALRRVAETATHERKTFITVFLGNYVDRGPDACGVITRLIALQNEHLGRLVFLRGNHEQILLDVIDGVDGTLRWLDFGAAETLKSYGLDPAADSSAKLRELASQMLPAHIAFLRRTEFHAKFGDYAFVHAGLRPDRALEEQSPADMLWFRYHPDDDQVRGETVVHGHSPHPRPVLGRGRIGIDTEAHASGALTLLRLEDTGRELFKIELGPDQLPRVQRWGEPSARDEHRPDAAANDAASRQKRATSRRWPTPGLLVLGGAGVALVAALTLTGVVKAHMGVKDRLVSILRRAQADSRLVDGPRASDRTPPVPVEVARGPVIERMGGAQLDGISPNQMSIPKDSPAPPPPQTIAAATRPAAPIATAPRPEIKRPLAAPAPAVAAKPPAIAAKPQLALRTSPPAAIAAPSKSSGPRVQIGAVISVERAHGAWADLARRFPAEMTAKTIEVEPVAVGDKTLYRAYVAGFDKRDDARRFCARIDAAGHPCIVRP